MPINNILPKKPADLPKPKTQNKRKPAGANNGNSNPICDQGR